MQSYIGCICLTCFHCIFLNVSSMYLDQRRHNRIGCIGLAFPRCAFSSASSGFLFDTVHTCNGCICLSFSHCVFPNASSNFLDQKCEMTLFAFVTIFTPVCLQMHPWMVCMQDCLLTLHCLHLFNFSLLCILKCVFFGNPNNIHICISIRTFLENRIIFVFGHFWDAE